MQCKRHVRFTQQKRTFAIEQHGRDATIVDWLDEIAADCPKPVKVSPANDL